MDLLFGGMLDAGGMGELDSVVAMDVIVVTVILEDAHLLASADQVVDTVFDLLW